MALTTSKINRANARFTRKSKAAADPGGTVMSEKAPVKKPGKMNDLSDRKQGSKVLFDKPGNFLYPIPAVMVSCGTMEKPNIITIAWTGTICSDPPMVSISVRPERYSYDIIKTSGEFVINLTTDRLLKACDYCGVKSGRDVDKFSETGLTPSESHTVGCPSIEESPVSIECKVRNMIPLGSHDMFIAEVTGVTVDSAYIDESGKFQMNQTGLTVYSHGKYLSLGKTLGKFGFSVKKPAKKKKRK